MNDRRRWIFDGVVWAAVTRALRPLADLRLQVTRRRACDRQPLVLKGGKSLEGHYSRVAVRSWTLPRYPRRLQQCDDIRVAPRGGID